jgi:hypothetical protein
MEEAIIVAETGFPPEVLDRMGQGTIDRLLIYLGVKAVAENGGEWQP